MLATASGSSSSPDLQPLLARRTTDYEKTIVTVTATSGSTLKKAFFFSTLAPDRSSVRVRFYDDRLDFFGDVGEVYLDVLAEFRALWSGHAGS